MKGKGLWGLAMVLALLAGALPVAAQGSATSQVVEEGGCLASVRPLANGVVQAWIYCAEDGYYPAGTARHLVAAPAGRPLSEPWALTDLSAFPGGLLTGEYWVQENAIAPAAVLTRALGPQEAIGRLLRITTRLRVQRTEAAQGDVESGLSLAVRQETTTRSGQGNGAGEQEHTLTQTRQRDETCTPNQEAPSASVQQRTEQPTQQQSRAQQGGGNGRGQGR